MCNLSEIKSKEFGATIFNFQNQDFNIDNLRLPLSAAQCSTTVASATSSAMGQHVRNLQLMSGQRQKKRNQSNTHQSLDVNYNIREKLRLTSPYSLKLNQTIKHLKVKPPRKTNNYFSKDRPQSTKSDQISQLSLSYGSLLRDALEFAKFKCSNNNQENVIQNKSRRKSVAESIQLQESVLMEQTLIAQRQFQQQFQRHRKSIKLPRNNDPLILQDSFSLIEDQNPKQTETINNSISYNQERQLQQEEIKMAQSEYDALSIQEAEIVSQVIRRLKSQQQRAQILNNNQLETAINEIFEENENQEQSQQIQIVEVIDLIKSDDDSPLLDTLIDSNNQAMSRNQQLMNTKSNQQDQDGGDIEDSQDFINALSDIQTDNQNVGNEVSIQESHQSIQIEPYNDEEACFIQEIQLIINQQEQSDQHNLKFITNQNLTIEENYLFEEYKIEERVNYEDVTRNDRQQKRNKIKRTQQIHKIETSINPLQGVDNYQFDHQGVESGLSRSKKSSEIMTFEFLQKIKEELLFNDEIRKFDNVAKYETRLNLDMELLDMTSPKEISNRRSFNDIMRMNVDNQEIAFKIDELIVKEGAKKRLSEIGEIISILQRQNQDEPTVGRLDSQKQDLNFFPLNDQFTRFQTMGGFCLNGTPNLSGRWLQDKSFYQSSDSSCQRRQSFASTPNRQGTQPDNQLLPDIEDPKLLNMNIEKYKVFSYQITGPEKKKLMLKTKVNGSEKILIRSQKTQKRRRTSSAEKSKISDVQQMIIDKLLEGEEYNLTLKYRLQSKTKSKPIYKLVKSCEIDNDIEMNLELQAMPEKLHNHDKKYFILQAENKFDTVLELQRTFSYDDFQKELLEIGIVLDTDSLALNTPLRNPLIDDFSQMHRYSYLEQEKVYDIEQIKNIKQMILLDDLIVYIKDLMIHEVNSGVFNNEHLLAYKLNSRLLKLIQKQIFIHYKRQLKKTPQVFQPLYKIAKYEITKDEFQGTNLFQRQGQYNEIVNTLSQQEDNQCVQLLHTLAYKKYFKILIYQMLVPMEEYSLMNDCIEIKIDGKGASQFKLQPVSILKKSKNTVYSSIRRKKSSNTIQIQLPEKWSNHKGGNYGFQNLKIGKHFSYICTISKGINHETGEGILAEIFVPVLIYDEEEQIRLKKKNIIWDNKQALEVEDQSASRIKIDFDTSQKKKLLKLGNKQFSYRNGSFRKILMQPTQFEDLKLKTSKYSPDSKGRYYSKRIQTSPLLRKKGLNNENDSKLVIQKVLSIQRKQIRLRLQKNRTYESIDMNISEELKLGYEVISLNKQIDDYEEIQSDLDDYNEQINEFVDLKKNQCRFEIDSISNQDNLDQESNEESFDQTPSTKIRNQIFKKSQTIKKGGSPSRSKNIKRMNTSFQRRHTQGLSWAQLGFMKKQHRAEQFNHTMRRSRQIREVQSSLLLDQMFESIKTNDYKTIYEMSRKGQLQLEARDVDGNTPLNIGTQQGLVDLVETLLKEGSFVNTQNNLGNTPLHYAKGYNFKRIFDLLMQFGANESVTNNEGKTPWELIKTQISV